MLTARPRSAFARAAERLDPTPDPYVLRPVDWVRDRLGGALTADQAAILRSVTENRYTAVPSAHDLGKSHVASAAVAHWIECHPSGSAFAVTTAPTDPQVKAILWREIGRRHREGQLRGRITLDAQWKEGHSDGPDELVAYGRKPSDTDPSAFQGIHAEYVLVVIDEAGGVPKTIFDAVDALATNRNARVLAIGNPDDPNSHFATICRPTSGWNVIHLDALRSPNFTASEVARFPNVAALMMAEGITPTTEIVPERLRPLLVSVDWVDERIRRWGVRSPLFEAKVRGRFPVISHDTLIEPGWVLQAQIREMEIDRTDARYGVDVARYGTDKTIVVERNGGHCRVVHEAHKDATTITAGHVALLIDGHGQRPAANVDDDGIGGAVTDILLEEGYEVCPIHNGSAAPETMSNGKPRFFNLRAAMWWDIREAFAGPTGDGTQGIIDIDPDDTELAAQLTNIKYTLNRHGQIVVETKDDMRKRKVDSPDRADALVYSWHRGDIQMPPIGSHTARRTIMGALLTEPM